MTVGNRAVLDMRAGKRRRQDSERIRHSDELIIADNRQILDRPRQIFKETNRATNPCERMSATLDRSAEINRRYRLTSEIDIIRNRIDLRRRITCSHHPQEFVGASDLEFGVKFVIRSQRHRQNSSNCRPHPSSL